MGSNPIDDGPGGVEEKMGVEVVISGPMGEGWTGSLEQEPSCGKSTFVTVMHPLHSAVKNRSGSVVCSACGTELKTKM